MYSDTSESSIEVPQEPHLDVEYPHREPSSEADYLEFFYSLFTINLSEVNQQEFKAYCSILEKAPEQIKEKIKQDSRIESFLFCCIARADVAINDLFEIYAPPNSQFFCNFIPILVWVFVSAKTKIFVEPMLVKNFENLKTEYQEFISTLPFVNQGQKLMHTPISNDEKNVVIKIYLAIFLRNIKNVSDYAVKCFFALVKNMTNGVDFPNPDIRNIEESMGLNKFLLQYSLSKEIILLLLFILSKISSQYEPKRREAIKDILNFTKKEIIPEGIFLATYLYQNLSCD